ncbi:MAG: hypothetical protein V1754_11540 [Pseudomonadota bacterium]
MQRLSSMFSGVLATGAILILGACGSATIYVHEICDNFVDDNGNGLVDCADPECIIFATCTSNLDGGVDGPSYDGPISDGAYKKKLDGNNMALLQAIMNELMLPKSGTDYAIDLDGNGTLDNKVGEIIGILDMFLSGVDLQAEVNNSIKSGQLLMMMEVFSYSLANDSSTTVQVHVGDDLDSNPADNFSGIEEFGISSLSPADVQLTGPVTNGFLKAGPGTLFAPLPLVPDKPPTTITIKRAQIHGNVSATGVTNGVLTGAIPVEEVDLVLIPALAEMLTYYMYAPNTPPGAKQVLTTFDTDKNGTISDDEIRNSMIAMALSGDVTIDPDPDAQPDALSLALGFNAVPCKINK